MELERLSVQLRPRNPWEAMDLGAAMLREWWRPVFGAWLIVYLPAVVVLHAAWLRQPAIAMVILWWLKPAFDRVVLHVLGSAVFGAPPTARAAVRGYRSYAGRGLLASLTVYRFDLARSFNLPVWQLEGLSGGAARRRAHALHRRVRSQAVWLTVICAHFELVLFLSAIGFAGMIVPPNAGGDGSLFALLSNADDGPLWRPLLQHAFHALAVSAIEPLCVAAGLALYLNRRTQLEAWDVELQLRRLAAGPASPRRAAGMIAIIVLMIWAGLSSPAHAADVPPGRAKEVVREVLADKAFDQYRDVKAWRYVGPDRDAGDSEPQGRSSGTDFGPLIAAIAELFRILAWVAGAAAIAWLLWIAVRHAGFWEDRVSPVYRPPDALFGLDLRPESLPDDVPAAAAALLREGQLRAALALLYRGALVRLTRERHVEVTASDTEADCMRRVAAVIPGETSQYFARLAVIWQRTAYADRPPSAAVAQALVQEWAAALAGNTRAVE